MAREPGSPVRLTRLELLAVPGIPMIAAGDDLATITGEAMTAAGLAPLAGDVVVVAQKIVSKAEGRCIELARVAPSSEARAIGAEIGKDPRVVELILGESRRIVRKRPGLLIVEHRLGYVMANGGVDQSNLDTRDGIERALLLPRDPDASAEGLRAALARRFAVDLAVVVNDSFGRAWRRGTCGVAIGSAGLPALIDARGTSDLFGRALKVTIIGFADEIAAAASLVQGQAAEAQPVVLVRGLDWTAPVLAASAICRPPEEDLFR